jgi:hypothetical protein
LLSVHYSSATSCDLASVLAKRPSGVNLAPYAATQPEQARGAAVIPSPATLLSRLRQPKISM